MKQNELTYGFKLLKKELIKDINATVNIYQHEKSGATLLYLDCDDTNKVFACGFRTLPEDSTGVCHIIEHSVLSGSEKYPLKEPFVNLLKGSMATFLNAFTASDWTSYPVASQTDKDFDNLMSCYLDACFSPLSIKDKKAFLQEGWHYEMMNIDDTPSIKGVVYNEMKGAMSSVEEVLMQETLNNMYKGSGYGVNSGGDPDVIPSLTYEYYQAFYKKHYHPENALLFLYGKMNIDEKLKFINDEYLSKYEKGGNKLTIKVPNDIVNMNAEKVYPCNEDNLDNNYYVSLCFGLDKYENTRELTAMKLLDEALMGSNSSPLKKALLESNLGEDVQSTLNDDCIKPCYGLALYKTKENTKDDFIKLTLNEVEKIVTNGLDKDLLLGVISNNEFKTKEMDTSRMPKGLLYYLWAIQNFVYDLPLEKSFMFEEDYKFFRENIESGYFESLLRKYILESKHKVCVKLIPSNTLQKEKEDKLNNEMLALKEKLSLTEKEKIVNETKELLKYQSKKDTLEELKMLPSLDIKDIELDINVLNKKVEKKEGTTFIEHDFFTNNISYLKMYFDLNVLKEDEIAFAKLLPSLLTTLDTEKYDAQTLQNMIKMYLGSLSFNYQPLADGNTLKPIFTLSVSALKQNVSYIASIVNEMINNIIFDEEKVKTNLVQNLNMEKMVIIQNGMGVATNNALKSASVYGALLSKTTGENYVKFLEKAINNTRETITKLSDVMKRIFNSNNLTVSLSGEKKQIEDLYDVCHKIILNDRKYDSILNVNKEPKESEALIVTSGVSYNAMALNLNDINLKYNGKLLVLAHIIRYDYLWNEIRVKGGAYGCGIGFSRNGDMVLGSFRDPNVVNTYNVYEATASYLEAFNPSDEEFKTYIIGTLGSFDMPESNNDKITSNDVRYFSGVTDEMRVKLKKEILSTTKEDIRKFSEIFKNIANNASRYTIGNETKINEYSLFTKKTSL